MQEYGRRRKRFYIKQADHLHAKLLAKLMEDGLQLGVFINAFLNAYSEDDATIRQWVEQHPELKISERSMKKRLIQQRRIKRESDKFNLDQKEIDEIFDIISDETGD